MTSESLEKLEENMQLLGSAFVLEFKKYHKDGVFLRAKMEQTSPYIKKMLKRIYGKNPIAISEEAWNRLGLFVKPEEKNKCTSFEIHEYTAFGWKKAPLYNISQMQGKDLLIYPKPLPKLILNMNLVIQSLKRIAKVESFKLLSQIKRVFPATPLTEKIVETIDGDYQSENNAIRVSKAAETFIIALHETLHAFVDKNICYRTICYRKPMDGFDEIKKDGFEEVMVETAVFMTAKHFGIDTSKRSIPYISFHAEKDSILEEVLPYSTALAATLISEIEGDQVLAHEIKTAAEKQTSGLSL